MENAFAKKVKKHILSVRTHLVLLMAWVKGTGTMETSNEYLNDQLNKAQKLLWGGSETENIEAHNIIARLIKDRVKEN